MQENCAETVDKDGTKIRLKVSLSYLPTVL
jgi:hypothetical protein